MRITTADAPQQRMWGGDKVPDKAPTPLHTRAPSSATHPKDAPYTSPPCVDKHITAKTEGVSERGGGLLVTALIIELHCNNLQFNNYLFLLCITINTKYYWQLPVKMINLNESNN